MSEEMAKRIVSTRKTVVAAGTAEKLVSDITGCYRVDISAETDNTDLVAIGSEDVVAAPGSQKGAILFPGENPITIYTNDVSKIYVDSVVNGEGVSFNYYIA